MEPFDFNFRHLDCVAAIGRAGSVSAAAAAVHLSQPAVTQGIAKIERLLGERLFVRHAGGMAPTEAGRRLILRIERFRGGLGAAVRGLKLGPAPVERLIAATHLRAFAAVVEHGGFGAAAVALGVSQPSVHRAARELERLLARPLLIRDGRRVTPTAAAARFVAQAKLALAELGAGLQEVAALRGDSAGRVAIGAMPLSRAALVPALVTTFRATLPGMPIAIVEGRYAELLVGLRAGELDLLIGARRDPAPEDVVQEPLFEDRLVIVGRAGHPLAGTRRAPLAALCAYPWIVSPSGTPLRARWQRMFAAGAVPPAPVECSSIVAIRGLLLEGDWLTLLSPAQVRFERDAGLLAHVGRPLADSSRTICATTRSGWLPTAAQAALIEAVRGAAARLAENQ